MTSAQAVLAVMAAGLYLAVAAGIARGLLAYAKERQHHLPGPARRVGAWRTLWYVALALAWPWSLLAAGVAVAVRRMLRETFGGDDG